MRKALLEGWASGMWTRCSGMLIWKTANPWAGLYVPSAPVVNPKFLVAGARALLEGWANGMWARYSGMLIWKTANPWAGLRLLSLRVINPKP